MASHLVTRAYNRFDISDDRMTITKRSFTDRLQDETAVYGGVPNEFALYFPRVVQSGTSPDGEHFLEMEYFAYPNAYWVMRDHYNMEAVETLADHLWMFLKASRISTISDVDGYDDVRKMYWDKTHHYLQQFIEGSRQFNGMFDHEELVINNTRYQQVIVTRAVEWILSHYRNRTVNPSFIHGDLCFSNILFGYDKLHSLSSIKLIDPRGRFGDSRVFGDHYYDLAKLMHSTHGGYEYIINDNFFVKDQDGTGQFWELRIPQNVNLQRVFEERIYSNYDIRLIKAIQGIIFIGMCSRHYDSEQRQVAMYLNGIKILNEVLSE